MADMKTPDFDDLLAAFDIPDIPDISDPDGNHNESIAGGKERSGGTNQKPTGPSEICATTHDPSVVSVIVKNSVCTDVFETRKEEDENIRQMSEVLEEAKRSEAARLSPQVAHSLMPTDPLSHNGFKAVSEGFVEPSSPPSQSQMQTEGHPWSPCSPRIAKESDESSQSKSHSNPSANFSPFPASAPSISCSDVTGILSSKVDEDEVKHPVSPACPFTPQNSSSRTGVHQTLSDDEESEPDLASPPLMIQESPDLTTSSPSKFPFSHRSSSELQPPSPCSPSSPISNDQTGETSAASQHPALSVPFQTPPQNIMPTLTTKNADPSSPEHYPEHIIEERDSPESPEPEKPSCPQSTELSTLVQELGEKETPQHIDIPDKKESVKNGDQLIKNNSYRDEVEKKTDPDEEKASAPVNPASAVSARPLKVRIKTVKTPTGNVTRTVTRLATKGATGKGSEIKIQGGKMATRPKRPANSMSHKPQDSKTPMLPVSTLQDASSAMLFAASKIQKVAATLSASSTSSPSQSSSSVNISLAGQKTVSVPSTKPASIVNTTGAVISRSQSSLVEAFNKILNSKNPLPSYQPDLSVLPRPEWGLGVPASGYRCLECGDTFALERSLARHYDRRSLRIEVTCNHCTKRLAFFNKCSLLLHAREHKEKGLVMQCSHLVMKPISMEQMVGQQDTLPIGVLSSSLLTSTSLPGYKEETAGSLGSFDNWCPECKSPFSSKEKLAAHFQESEPAGLDTCCTQCSPPMPLWNSCSASAHQRLHQTLSPVICPECGLVCQAQTLNTHLYKTCLHYTRQLGYRCPCCQLVFGGVNSLSAAKNHMHTAHCEVFHKCPSCPMAFKFASSTDAHCRTQHPDIPDTAKQSKEIFKCVMCRTVFTQKTLLYHHFDTHLGTQKVPVFKCPDCNKLFTQRASLIEHIKASHRKSAAHLIQKGSVKMESSDGEEEEDEETEGDQREKRSAALNVQLWSCTECQTRYRDKESYISHMAKQHRKELKRFPCMLCEGSFSSSSSLRRHIRVKHKGIKRSFYCQLCAGSKKSFSSKLVLEKHIQIHHGGQRGANVQGQVKSRLPDAADSSSEQDGAFNTAAEHKTVAKKLSQAQYSSAQEAKGLRCMPCGFVSEDKEEFALHIQTHRGDGGKSMQCQQCGACFASGSSLSRHLFISHRVRDREPDDQRENATPDAMLEAESPGSPSRSEDGEGKMGCKVCGRQFSKAADLSTHFRTHGMAFISAYKSEKPA
ncbi:zinc finger protein 687a [Trichomycterus rosablanca]|uniref:zinc finger protein 687a n=1 Tax=Trichomycterus rosablanca TaxID=2290929 RepID=UPI002F3588D5